MAKLDKRSLWLNGMRENKETGEREEYVWERYEKYLCPDFSRLLDTCCNAVRQ